jgi:hypothetical protein
MTIAKFNILIINNPAGRRTPIGLPSSKMGLNKKIK